MRAHVTMVFAWSDLIVWYLYSIASLRAYRLKKFAPLAKFFRWLFHSCKVVRLSLWNFSLKQSEVLFVSWRFYAQCRQALIVRNADISYRRVVKNFQKGGLFWKLETPANDLDPDFDQSLTRLRRFFCQTQMISPPQKKGLHWYWVGFSIQIHVIENSNFTHFQVQITSGP